MIPPIVSGSQTIKAWVSASFWPLIIPGPARFVKEIKELLRIEGLVIEGRSGCNLFRDIPYTPVMTLQLSLWCTFCVIGLYFILVMHRYGILPII